MMQLIERAPEGRGNLTGIRLATETNSEDVCKDVNHYNLKIVQLSVFKSHQASIKV